MIDWLLVKDLAEDIFSSAKLPSIKTATDFGILSLLLTHEYALPLV